MKYLAVILLVVFLASGSGCDGDGNTPSENGGNGNGGNEDGGSSTVLLALGDVKLSLGPVLAALFMVTEPGTLKATVTWSSADPDRVDVYFLHEGTYMGFTEGSSGVTLTQTVTAAHVAGGTTWKLYITDQLATQGTVSYKVEFTPD